MDGFFGNTQADSSPDNLRTSSSSRVSLTPNDTTRESPPEAPIAKADSGQIKKRGRKGHSKSRTGCFNCKKARIKVIYTDYMPQAPQLMSDPVQGKPALL